MVTNYHDLFPNLHGVFPSLTTLFEVSLCFSSAQMLVIEVVEASPGTMTVLTMEIIYGYASVSHSFGYALMVS